MGMFTARRLIGPVHVKILLLTCNLCLLNTLIIPKMREVWRWEDVIFVRLVQRIELINAYYILICILAQEFCILAGWCSGERQVLTLGFERCMLNGYVDIDPCYQIYLMTYLTFHVYVGINLGIQ